MEKRHFKQTGKNFADEVDVVEVSSRSKYLKLLCVNAANWPDAQLPRVSYTRGQELKAQVGRRASMLLRSL